MQRFGDGTISLSCSGGLSHNFALRDLLYDLAAQRGWGLGCSAAWAVRCG